MQRSGTIARGTPPQTGSTMGSDGTGRRRLVSVLLSVSIIMLSGACLYWLQWASQEGITVGYPVPYAHITVPTTHALLLHQNYQFLAYVSGRDITTVWDFGDQSSALGESAVHSYQSNGTFTVVVTVRDPTGRYSSDSTEVTVKPPVPQAAFTYTLSDFGYATFDASNSSADPSTAIASYQWDFGDGTTDTTTTPQESHYFISTGTFQVVLVVVDATGQQSGPAAATITV